MASNKEILEQKKKELIGKVYETNNCGDVKIIDYLGANNVIVMFLKTNTKKIGVKYRQILSGMVEDETQSLYYNIVGKRFKTNHGCEYEVIEYTNSKDVKIRFLSSGHEKNVTTGNITRGLIDDPYRRSVCGVGCFGDGKHVSRENGEKTKKYDMWNGMIKRCYNEASLKNYPTYERCYVIKEWLNFQTFGDWFDVNYVLGFHLDKDILSKDISIYSTKTCLFVPPEINSFFNFNMKRSSIKNGLPIGISKKKYNDDNGFCARICMDGKEITLGTFPTIEEAFSIYKTTKEAHIKVLAERHKPTISDECYSALLSYIVEMTY
jgi:hypothetical protein